MKLYMYFVQSIMITLYCFFGVMAPGGGGTLIFSQICRLGPFGFSEK